MRFMWLVVGAVLCSLAPSAVAVQHDDVIVTASSARVEIERILAADNIDTDTLDSRVVADTMSGIARGGAPNDFWRAYQAHVAAWRILADAEDRASIVRTDPTSLRNRVTEVAIAERRVERTFDDVERIARRYGARLPAPRSRIKSMH